MTTKTSGSGPYAFALCGDLSVLPERAKAHEKALHGGFAWDKRPGKGEIYYGMPGCGLMRIGADLTRQDIIDLPPDLVAANFHSTKIGEFDGKVRLFLPSTSHFLVAVVSLEGEVEFVLPRPEFEEYRDAEVKFLPTDTAQDGGRLLVADGYGANYISTASLSGRRWTDRFGGKTKDPQEHGKFGTAHGINRTPDGSHLAIADRPHSRIEITTLGGDYRKTHLMPAGSRPCGIDFIQRRGRWLAVVGSLDDPDKEKGRPAPIYVLDGETFEVLSTVRPKEELGIELADHIHNVVWHEHGGRLFLVCQAWNPGHYFVLELAGSM